MPRISQKRKDGFFATFFRLGRTMALFTRLHNDEKLFAWLIRVLKDELDTGLVNGAFTPAEKIFERFQDLDVSCERRFRWIGSQKPPKHPGGDVAIVLDITLGTLEDTLKFAWMWLEYATSMIRGMEMFFPDEDGNGRCGIEEMDFAKYQIIDGAPPFEPWTMRWRLIKLNANMGESCADARDPKKSPGVAAIFAAAQHPHRVELIDPQRRRYGNAWFVPGLRTESGEVCGVDFDKGVIREGMWQSFAMTEDFEDQGWADRAVPELVDVD